MFACPPQSSGYVPTRMARGLQAYTGGADISTGVPLGRLGSASDMGGAAVYLASPAGAWVTGTILTVDGGQVSQPIAMEMGTRLGDDAADAKPRL